MQRSLLRADFLLLLHLATVAASHDSTCMRDATPTTVDASVLVCAVCGSPLLRITRRLDKWQPVASPLARVPVREADHPHAAVAVRAPADAARRRRVRMRVAVRVRPAASLRRVAVLRHAAVPARNAPPVPAARIASRVEASRADAVTVRRLQRRSRR